MSYTPMPYRKNENNGKNPIFLELVHRENGTHLIAVNSSGEVIATLIVFQNGKVQPVRFAFEQLDKGNYDTSFAEWHGTGKIMMSLPLF